MTNQTPESVIAEAMVNAGAPLMHSRVEEGVASALRAANMLREPGVPDAATAAITRVRAIHKLGWQEEPYGNGPDGQVLYRKVSWCLHCDMASPCDTLAALDGAPEPEWEYGWAGEDDASPWRLDQEFESVQEAESFASSADRAWVRRGGGHIVRRRKAGQWESVEGESK